MKKKMLNVCRIQMVNIFVKRDLKVKKVKNIHERLVRT